MSRGIVVAQQPEAAEAGADVLARGGNAVDAAICAALVQTVVDPLMCGLAGFGTMQILMPRKGFHGCIDFHGRVPAAARPDMWLDRILGETRDGFGFLLEGQVNELGYQAITVPGALRAYAEAVAQHGTMPLSELLGPAIAAAEDGFLVRPYMVSYWNKRNNLGRVENNRRITHTPAARRLFLDASGTPLTEGAVMRNPEMARTLRRIAAEGADSFYTGAIAAEIAADMEAHGALLSAEDLRTYRTRHVEPLLGSYRGLRVATAQPPAGGVVLLEMLAMLEHFDLAAMGHNSPAYIRTVAEAMKRAIRDKDAHVGDPAFVDVPLDRLLSPDYARANAEEIRRGVKADVTRIGPEESKDTTHVSAMDAAGNVVTMTHSLGTPSGVITDGLGFMYNGCMNVFDPRPGRAGSIAPGKSRFTAMAPTIVLDGAQPVLVLGAPGAAHITHAVLQALLNVVDFGMTALEAVSAPRFSATSNVIDVCNRIPRRVTAALEAEGYRIARSAASYAFAHVHAIHARDGVLSGAADPQSDGMAMLA